MVGVFMFIIYIGVCLAKAIKPTWDEFKRIEDAKKYGSKYYVARDGLITDLKTGIATERYYDTRLKADVMKNARTGEVLRNYTQERRAEYVRVAKERAIKNGEKFYTFELIGKHGTDPEDIEKYFDGTDYYRLYEHKGEEIEGVRYKNIETNEVYVIRYVDCLTYFLLNINTRDIDYIMWKCMKGKDNKIIIPEEDLVDDLKVDDTVENRYAVYKAIKYLLDNKSKRIRVVDRFHLKNHLNFRFFILPDILKGDF